MSEWMGGWANKPKQSLASPPHVPSSLHMSSFLLAAVSCCGGSHTPSLSSVHMHAHPSFQAVVPNCPQSPKLFLRS